MGEIVAMKIKEWWPPIACISIYYVSIACAVYISAKTNDGRLIYPLDDTYIHMAIAKNFAEYGVWGITRYAFSSSTTSPLYTGILAAVYMLLGHHDIIPLSLNLLFGTVLIIYLYRLFRQEASPPAALALLLVVSFVTSLPALTLLGMEHLLHLLLTLNFIYLSATSLATRTTLPRQNRALILLASLVPLARYEGCFAVAIVSGFLFLQKRYRFAVRLTAAGALPLLLYGFVCHMHNWLPIPNSVLLKGNIPDISSLQSILKDASGRPAIRALFNNPTVLLVFVLTLTACFRFARVSSHNETAPVWWKGVIFVSILLVHLQIADTGWLFRYEAYLVGTGLALTLPPVLTMLLPFLCNLNPLRLCRLPLLIPLIGLLVLVVPFAERGCNAWTKTITAMHDRYLEHIQPTRFLNEYYPRSTVVVNDIGAVAYLTECPLLDMYGLGNMEPVRFRFSKTDYTKRQVEEWATSKNADIAVLQIEWGEIRPRIPDSWVKVAEWKIPRNVVFGDLRIGWFAVKKELSNALSTHLLAFQARMPADIETKMIINPANELDAGDGK